MQPLSVCESLNLKPAFLISQKPLPPPSLSAARVTFVTIKFLGFSNNHFDDGVGFHVHVCVTDAFMMSL